MNKKDTFKQYYQAHWASIKGRSGVNKTARVLLFNRQGSKVLIIRKSPTDAWELPGGTHKPDEHMEQTASRELQEEAHAVGFNYELLGIASILKKDKNKVKSLVVRQVYFYKADLKSILNAKKDPGTDTMWQLKWVKAKSLPKYVKLGEVSTDILGEILRV